MSSRLHSQYLHVVLFYTDILLVSDCSSSDLLPGFISPEVTRGMSCVTQLIPNAWVLQFPTFIAVFTVEFLLLKFNSY